MENISLFGTGNETRDFIHIQDFVVLIQIIIEKAAFSGEIYNAGCGVQTSIKHVATIFEEHYQNKRTICFDGNLRNGDPLNWEADITFTKNLGFLPTINFRSGLIDYINWFKSLK